jgi:hypothetical protein
MRIGTWNLDAGWTRRHAAVLSDADCDVWLVTEMVDGVSLPGYAVHFCAARMSPGQHYAAVLSRLAMEPLSDPHPASAAVRIDGLTFCSSVLPWRSKDDPLVWGEGDQGARTTAAVQALRASLIPSESVWGGDFNHPLVGSTRWCGSAAGRQAIEQLATSLGITMVTASLPGRLAGTCSIDHIGVPTAWTITEASRIALPPALSDHDAYVVTASRETE